MQNTAGVGIITAPAAGQLIAEYVVLDEPLTLTVAARSITRFMEER